MYQVLKNSNVAFDYQKKQPCAVSDKWCGDNVINTFDHKVAVKLSLALRAAVVEDTPCLYN